MSVIEDNFVPQRLRMARLARMIRQKDLAEIIGRSDATVSKWESDDYTQEPDSAIIPALAKALNVESQWFFKPVAVAKNASFFRSLKSEYSKFRDKAEARLDFVEEIETVLTEYVELPSVNVPDFLNGRDFRTLRSNDIEYYSKSLREYWELSEEPIDDLLMVMENAGIVLAHDEIGSDKLDGVSRWSVSDRPYTLLAQDKHIAVRRRFDAAHELGHIILHKSVTHEQLSNNFKLIEDQAMAFAGAFLMPVSSFGDDVFSLSLDSLLSIKKKWKTSVAGMIKRLSFMEVISADYERNLWKYYSYRGWRGLEPFDEELPIEQPHNLRMAIEMILSEGVIPSSELIRKIGLSVTDVSELTGVEESILSPNKSPSRQMPLLRQSATAECRDNVISFPISK